MNSKEITTQISEAANSLNLKKWDYGASFSNDYSVQVDNGEAKEVMPKISMCGNDLELAPGFCGSISGSVNVTVGQPHIKVDSITVGGR